LKFLVDEYSPNFIVLFGSAAKGEDTASSDIDIFLKAKDAKKSLTAYEKKLGRKIHLFCSEDFRKLKEEFKNSILNGIKMYGYIKIY
jgi:predicted nucleotidyltransferase